MDNAPRWPGLLVVLEGIDGSGKSTLARGLQEALSTAGYQVVMTKEPTDGPLGQKIRELAANNQRESITAEEEFQLFHQDREQHVQSLVRPSLEEGKVVLQDRSYFSTMAYQSLRGLHPDGIRLRSEQIAPFPDILLVVDLQAHIGLERISGREGGTDEFERVQDLRAVRKCFLTLEGADILNGDLSKEEVLAAGLKVVKAALERRKNIQLPVPRNPEAPGL